MEKDTILCPHNACPYLQKYNEKINGEGGSLYPWVGLSPIRKTETGYVCESNQIQNRSNPLPGCAQIEVMNMLAEILRNQT